MASTDLQDCAAFHRAKAEELRASLGRRPFHMIPYVKRSIDKHEAWAGSIDLAQATLRGIKTWQD